MGDVRGGADSLRYHRVADLAEKFKIGHQLLCRDPDTIRALREPCGGELRKPT